jgi:hypothetical protein
LERHAALLSAKFPWARGARPDQAMASANGACRSGSTPPGSSAVR